MTREERLQFCNVCRNQKTSLKQGLVCKITNEVPQFEGTCNLYDEDTDLKKRLNRIDPTEPYLPAGPGKRFLNFIIDAICYYIFAFLLGGMMGIVLALTAPERATTFFDNKLIMYGFGFIVLFTYYTLSESISGRTIGKLITGTKVINERGETPSFSTIALRSVCRFIPFEAFSFLGNDAGWHDTLSKTSVVEIPKS
jgi:uncharacterized RDD family membrane protein YckC